MTLLSSTQLFWALGTIQIVGLLIAFITRLAEGSCRQGRCQVLFCAALVSVGVATIMALQLGPACWIVSSATFSLMVLTVTCDLRPYMNMAE